MSAGASAVDQGTTTEGVYDARCKRAETARATVVPEPPTDTPVGAATPEASISMVGARGSLTPGSMCPQSGPFAEQCPSDDARPVHEVCGVTSAPQTENCRMRLIGTGELQSVCRSTNDMNVESPTQRSSEPVEHPGPTPSTDGSAPLESPPAMAAVAPAVETVAPAEPTGDTCSPVCPHGLVACARPTPAPGLHNPPRTAAPCCTARGGHTRAGLGVRGRVACLSGVHSPRAADRVT